METVITKLKAILDTLKDDCHFVCIDGFCHEPKGGKQESDVDGFVHEWVDQSCGVAGDDWHGNIYFEIEPKVFARVYFTS